MIEKEVIRVVEEFIAAAAAAAKDNSDDDDDDDNPIKSNHGCRLLLFSVIYNTYNTL